MSGSDRLLLNIDTGERGADHPVDLALVEHADVVNVACGGHAGDEGSVRVFEDLAGRLGKTVAAHLSYPDPQHFGRRRMDLPTAQLLEALDTQRGLLPGARWLKFHGALYHEADRDPALAEALAGWLKGAGFAAVIGPAPGVFERAVRDRGLAVLAEAFVERRYRREPDTGRPVLVPRSEADACLATLNEAMAQAEGLIRRREVRLAPSGEAQRIEADTLCIHSDSPIALELAAALSARLRPRKPLDPGEVGETP